MKCVAGHQPNLYPYGGFFAKAASVDTFVIVDNTQYVKKEYHNRNRILLLNSQIQWLNIPVQNAGNYKQKINEAKIDNSSNWKKKHLRTLALNYKKAPFFDYLFPELQLLLQEEWIYLADFNIACIKLFFRLLEIKTPTILASESKIEGVSSSLILDICKKTNSETYLHGKHARDYVDFSFLSEAGITNLIQDFSPNKYPQLSHDFVPNLSIIDLIFNCGFKTLDFLLKSQKITEEKE